jgi:hypothetical protein
VPIRAYFRKDLALAQLQTALRLYFEAGDRGSVITLAGAADEIFGKLIAASGGDNSLMFLIEAVTEIQKKVFGEPIKPKQIAARANAARNSLKHWDVGDTEIVKFDLEIEARDMLNRAIDNYWMLEHKLTPEMERFQHELKAA